MDDQLNHPFDTGLGSRVDHGFGLWPITAAVALEAVRYDAASGLVPVVVQDVASGNVLMLAYANREALKRTFGTGQAWFWSRSRQDLWRKGATSGNTLAVTEVRIDCDGDTVLYLVQAAGPACHTGAPSCFYRQLERQTSATAGTVDASPTPVVGGMSQGIAFRSNSAAADAVGPTITGEMPNFSDSDVLRDLWLLVDRRWRERPQGSYTTYLFEQGVDKSAKKVGEEAVEVVLAAKNALGLSGLTATGQSELAAESADLLYHLMVLWRACGLSPADVFTVLADRAK